MTKSGRGAPRAPVQGDSHPAGGVGPACRSIRGRIRASTGPLVALALPAPLGQGGGRQPSPPAVRGGIWADVSPLGRMQKPPFRKGGGAEGPGGFHFQPEGLAARRLALKDCKMTPSGTPTAGRGKCRHTYFLPTCLAAFAGGT